MELKNISKYIIYVLFQILFGLIAMDDNKNAASDNLTNEANKLFQEMNTKYASRLNNRAANIVSDILKRLRLYDASAGYTEYIVNSSIDSVLEKEIRNMLPLFKLDFRGEFEFYRRTKIRISWATFNEAWYGESDIFYVMNHAQCVRDDAIYALNTSSNVADAVSLARSMP